MVVDAECGMPLDLGKWEALWEDGADDSGAHRFDFPYPLPLPSSSLSDTPPIFFFAS